jgi:hypothetical protein
MTKLHWTQTTEGKAKLAAAQRKSWRSGRRKKRARSHITAPSPNGQITIPYELARLLASTRTDLKNPSRYNEVHGLAQSMLRLLMSLPR